MKVHKRVRASQGRVYLNWRKEKMKTKKMKMARKNHIAWIVGTVLILAWAIGVLPIFAQW